MRRDIVVENDIVIERIPLVPVCQLKLFLKSFSARTK